MKRYVVSLWLCLSCITWATEAIGDESIHCKTCAASPNDQAVRDSAERRVSWQHPRLSAIKAPIDIKILGFNDFHGHISTGTVVAGRAAGGAAVFTSYIKAAQVGKEDRTFIVHAGDAVGATPLSSALLRDEPTMIWLNSLGNDFCRYEARLNPRCNVVGTLGNHEFDRGVDAMMRLIQGSDETVSPSFVPVYRGVSFPYVSANVVDAVSGKPVLPPYVIKEVRYKRGHRKTGVVRIAFIGAVLKDTPSIVTPSGVAGVKFIDEAAAINRYVPEIRAKGAKAIVVLIHQGGFQTVGDNVNATGKPPLYGDITDIVARLDDHIDLVVSGHTHTFTNAVLPNGQGKPILVTQAFSYGTAYSDIELKIDRKSGAVVEKSAAVITTFADRGAGLSPDAAAAALTARAEALAAPIANRLIGTITGDITRKLNDAGESSLGGFIADAQRHAMRTQIAFMNAGGIRSDLRFIAAPTSPADTGAVTYNDLFTVQPFGNSLVKMTLTGQQIVDVLNQQFPPYQPYPRMLQVSGLTYTWDANRPDNNKVISVNVDGTAIDNDAVYSVTVNSFIAGGGDKFTIFNKGGNRVGGPLDIDALMDYIKHLPQPIAPTVPGRRIVRIN